MTGHSAQDRRVDAVKDRLHDELVDDAGAPADATRVHAVVEAAADGRPQQRWGEVADGDGPRLSAQQGFADERPAD